MNAYLVKWESGLYSGNAVVVAASSIEAWERFVTNWEEKDKTESLRIVKLENLNKFSVELVSKEFLP